MHFIYKIGFNNKFLIYFPCFYIFKTFIRIGFCKIICHMSIDKLFCIKLPLSSISLFHPPCSWIIPWPPFIYCNSSLFNFVFSSLIKIPLLYFYKKIFPIIYFNKYVINLFLSNGKILDFSNIQVILLDVFRFLSQWPWGMFAYRCIMG